MHTCIQSSDANGCSLSMCEQTLGLLQEQEGHSWLVHGLRAQGPEFYPW